PNGASALRYIPEVSWNDTAELNEFASTGGGGSALFAKPWWQVGPGVPDDKARDIPDISLSASPQNGAYLVTTSGVSTAFGGTSAGSPAFASLVALLNQYLVQQKVLGQPGLGNINPTLYRLAQSNPEIFHDITGGDNKSPCPQSTPGCVNG